MGLLEAAFLKSGHTSAEAKQTYSDLNAVLGDTGQAVEAAQHIALIADNEKEMNDLVAIGTGVFANFGASLPLEGMFEAVNHTASLGEVQGSLADALEWSGITVEEFNGKLEKISSEEERQDLIVQTLKDTYSKAGDQYKETNKDVMEANKAQERLTDAFAELGRIGEPILTNIKNAVAAFVEAAAPKLEALIQKVKDVKQWVEDNEQTIINWGAAIAGASVSVGLFLLILNWGKIMTAAKTALMAVRTAVMLFNAALKANPIGLVVSLLAGLVTAFVILWNKNEAFRKFWIDLWAKIKSASATAVDWIKDKLDSLGKTADKVGKWFGDIRDSAAKSFDDAWKSVKKVIDKITGLFPLKLGKIFDNIKIPKISVSGGEAPYGIAGFGKLPSFSVKWNAEGGVLTQPTIFGQTGNTLLGGGEAGKEAVAPIDVLKDYVAEAVRSENGNIGRILIDQFRLLMDFLARSMPNSVVLDSGAVVGALTPAIDVRLNDRWQHAQRGNVR
jgi:gas vesicle protein